jgi:hypothetical protein
MTPQQPESGEGIAKYWRDRWDRAQSKQEVFAALLFHYCSVSETQGIAGSHSPPSEPSAENRGLPRFGLQWNGPEEFVATPMPDGYWTPWHLADAALRAAEGQRPRSSETDVTQEGT